ncbi:unnamed protein product [Kluyveromyces dobzhanskii CBS 2104]|uniref:Mitochondrial translation factor ATP22 n=1 Tax=Kluyveromyces dobzhanskii CBS 2104 TaxID=1427455 RepID=A0A0A8L7N6_9SACH|nr:unnamed protein product [Kluyveromyces dobzhanskii CBS 2104]
MLAVSRGIRHVRSYANQYRFISSVSKEEVFGIINETKISQEWTVLRQDPRILNYVKEALNNPTSENVSELMQLKRKMMRALQKNYPHAVRHIEEGLPNTIDRLKFRSEFLRVVNTEHYACFLKSLEHIRTCKGLDRQTRRKELYKCIELHRRCNPGVTEASGILLPNNIHQWLFTSTPPEERLNHYLFLIDNTVLISGHFAQLTQQTMLNGSKMEYRVASFLHFIEDPEKHHIFNEKFSVMHTFGSMRRIVNLLIEENDVSHIKEYLDILTTRLQTVELRNQRIPYEVRKLYFIEFMHTLQQFARSTNHIDMFLETINTMIEYLPKDTPVPFIRNSFVEILNYFQSTGDTETVFKVMSILNDYPLTKPNTKFTNEMLGRILFSLRQFKDPKLTASYILITYNFIKSKEMLNNLGLWCLIFGNGFGHLNKKMILDTKQPDRFINLNVPECLRSKHAPDSVVLNELYIVVFDYYKGKLPSEEYKDLILTCYKSYCRFLKENVEAQLRWKIDTSILRTMIHRVKFDCLDDRLAYEMLMNFFSLNLNPRFNSKNTPFGLVLYRNENINQQEFNNVLELMQKCRAPMDHKVMITIVLKFIQSGSTELAHEWYSRLLKTGYQLRHFRMIEEAKKLGWEVPASAEEYLQECERKNQLEDDNFDDMYLQNPTEDAYTDELIETARDIGRIYGESLAKHSPPKKGSAN